MFSSLQRQVMKEQTFDTTYPECPDRYLIMIEHSSINECYMFNMANIYMAKISRN